MNEEIVSKGKRMIQVFKEIDALQKEEKELRDYIAEAISPYKIGDIVDIHGWSHNGKNGRITGIGLERSENTLNIIVTAKVLRKDGTDSLFSARWTSGTWVRDKDQKLDDALQYFLESINEKSLNT